jgi:metal-responsive CopG/Arc/MetJ family transcriptional regulator
MADTKIEKMEKKRIQIKPEPKCLNIMLPEELIKRVDTICAEKEMSVQDFVMDAIIEKLQLVYKERRKKPRL